MELVMNHNQNKDEICQTYFHWNSSLAHLLSWLHRFLVNSHHPHPAMKHFFGLNSDSYLSYERKICFHSSKSFFRLNQLSQLFHEKRGYSTALCLQLVSSFKCAWSSLSLSNRLMKKTMRRERTCTTLRERRMMIAREQKKISDFPRRRFFSTYTCVRCRWQPEEGRKSSQWEYVEPSNLK